VVTIPEGAEIRQGDRVFGVTPKAVELPSSTLPMQLSFHRDGFEPAAATVVPSASQSVEVKLTPRRPHHVKTRPAAPVHPSAPAPRPPSSRPAGAETLPNPY
jgi:hypothetical protein